MALIQFIIEGFDPTILGAEDCITPAELLAMIHEAQPASNIGGEIHSQTSPDAVTYPAYARFTWVELDGSDVPTGNEYRWDGSAWTLKVPPVGSVDGDTLTNGSVGLVKLLPAAPYQLIQMNAGGTSWVDVSPASIFTANLIPLNSLANAPGDAYMLVSTTGGVWTYASIAAQLEFTFADIGVNFSWVKDLDAAGLTGQVAYVADDETGILGFTWVEDRLRDNQIALNKLNWGAANASKIPVVNTTGTDVDFKTPSELLAIRAIVVKATAAAGVGAQTISGVGPTIVELNSITPSSGSFASLATNQISVPSGTYLFDVDLPIHGLQAAGTLVQVQLYNATSSTIEATASATRTIDGDYSLINLKHYVTPAVATAYEIRVWVDAFHATMDTLGLPVNLNSLGEVYTQVAVLKLS